MPELCVMLDNAAIQCTEVTRRTDAYYNFQMNYFSTYCPHLVTVKVVFEIAKRNLINLKTGVPLNFSKATGKKIIAYFFNAIKPSTMSERWTRTIWRPKHPLELTKRCKEMTPKLEYQVSISMCRLAPFSLCIVIEFQLG